MPSFTHRDTGNINPQLVIQDIPRTTKSMVLTMRDIDAGDAYHWAVWNIPADKDTIFQGDNFVLSPGVVIGDNDFGTGYTGPFPPALHSYRFEVFCLDDTITLNPADYANLPTAIAPKLITSDDLIGKMGN